MTHDFTLHLIISTLENDTRRGRVLFYPEVSAYEQREERLRRELEELTAAKFRGLPLLEVHQRHAAGTPELHETIIEIAPPEHSPAWETPVRLALPAICRRHGESAAVGYVPALEIEVVADRWEDLAERIAQEIHQLGDLERHLLAPLAARLNEYSSETALAADVE